MIYEKMLAHLASAPVQTGFKATKSQRMAIDKLLSFIGREDKRIDYIYNNDSGVVIIILKGNVELRIGKRGKIN